MVCWNDFCLGKESLVLYSQTEKFERVVHALVFPFLAYSVLGLLPLLLKFVTGSRYDSDISFKIWAVFSMYYLLLDPVSGLLTSMLYTIPLMRAVLDLETNKTLTFYITLVMTLFVLIFIAPIHSLNNVVVGPLGGIRALVA